MLNSLMTQASVNRNIVFDLFCVLIFFTNHSCCSRRVQLPTCRYSAVARFGIITP